MSNRIAEAAAVSQLVRAVSQQVGSKNAVALQEHSAVVGQDRSQNLYRGQGLFHSRDPLSRCRWKKTHATVGVDFATWRIIGVDFPDMKAHAG